MTDNINREVNFVRATQRWIEQTNYKQLFDVFESNHCFQLFITLDNKSLYRLSVAKGDKLITIKRYYNRRIQTVCGSINDKGQLTLTLDSKISLKLAVQLFDLLTNPEREFVYFAKTTKRCSFCNTSLTNEQIKLKEYTHKHHEKQENKT